MLLCDTGVLLAAGNVKDHHHAACLALMRAAKGPLLVPSPVLGEIGYLLQSRVGPHAEVTFLKSFGGNGFHVAEVEEGDISRITKLVEQYSSLPLGIVDAAVIAIAERLNLTEVASGWAGLLRSAHSCTAPVTSSPSASPSSVWDAPAGSQTAITCAVSPPSM
jgi:predicted nucleic acid-binding protein